MSYQLKLGNFASLCNTISGTSITLKMLADSLPSAKVLGKGFKS